MKIKVFQQHTHAGVTFPEGSEIDLPEADALWMLGIEQARRAEMVKDQDAFRTIFSTAVKDDNDA